MRRNSFESDRVERLVFSDDHIERWGRIWDQHELRQKLRIRFVDFLKHPRAYVYHAFPRHRVDDGGAA